MMSRNLASSQTFQSIERVAISLRRYTQVILALLRREEERRLHSPMESLLDLLEPCMLIVLMSSLHYFFGGRHSSPLGGSPVLFYATGFFAKYFWIYISRMSRSIDRPSRRFPVERRLDHILVHIIISTIEYIILGILTFGAIYIFVTPAALPFDFIPLLEASVAILMLGFGWGMLNMSLSKRFWLWTYIDGPVRRVSIFFSGVFFIVDFLPPNIRYILSFNPMLHAIILFRSAFYPNNPTLVLDTAYLTYCAVFAVVFGLLLERITAREEAA